MKKIAEVEKSEDCKYHSSLNGYLIFAGEYMSSEGRMCRQYVAYPETQLGSQEYRIARASLKSLKKELEIGQG